MLLYIQRTNKEGRPSWTVLPKEAKEFLTEVYDSGIWDSQFSEKRNRLAESNPLTLSLDDVYSYFTAIIATERVFRGFYEQCAYDGTLEKLIARYLELTHEQEEQS